MPAPQRILILTGKLAESLVRDVARELTQSTGIEFTVHVLPITVAALMHARWIGQKLNISGHFDRVLIPGDCQGDVNSLTGQFGIPFERGPKDIRELPQFFGQNSRAAPDLSAFDTELIAEINHAPALSDRELVQQARQLHSSGADVIDLGCIPGQSWSRAGEVTRLLKREGLRISIDSFDRAEVEAAVAAGAELVLSCNSSNLDWAKELMAELVAIPDLPSDLPSLDRTIDSLADASASFRVDPILEPIGFGFAASLARYFNVRRRHPDLELMMGVGNLTELTEVDSAALNFLLASICQELRIRSVLTTQVISWAATSVKELDLARRLARHSIQNRVLPKHVDHRLLLLRDPPRKDFGDEFFRQLAGQIADRNFRIFVERDEIHVLNRDGYWRGTDPFVLFEQFAAVSNLDASHAFYLGYELAKAVTALTLGKSYTQDQALRWGFLTIPEISRHDRSQGPSQDTPID